MSHSSHSHRPLALATALALAGACVVPAAAAEPIGDGVAPTYDEAYYATLDYYGNLTEGSVVKSYTVNGASSLTDYGDYDEIVNLTDDRVPTSAAGGNVFSFDGDAGAFADKVARKIVADLGSRRWFVTDGTLDDHLSLVAAETDRQLNLICLRHKCRSILI